MAYSKDYRQMIGGKVEAGYSYRELAEEFQLSITTIQKWIKQIARNPYFKRINKINPELLQQAVEQYPDHFQ